MLKSAVLKTETLTMETLNRDAIMRLIPHQGRSCLLDRLLDWDDDVIACSTITHLAADHPLRHAGRLHPICGAEYGMQAAALHGALRSQGQARSGLLISLRAVQWHVARLDDAAHGDVTVRAQREGDNAAGHLYGFQLIAQNGACLVEGRGLVALQ